jgi:hypothetical protein
MGLFDEVYRMLDAITNEAEYYAREAQTAFTDQIPNMESSLLSSFIEAAVDAMDRTPEYSTAEAGPLRNQLIRNLSTVAGDGRPVHIRINSEGRVDIFDEDFAGTAGDFAQARHPSKNPQQTRYRFWKYGIYARDVTGDYEPSSQTWFNEAVDNLPSYGEIIDERLSVWGEKAPYWYFIEYGTAGGGRGWPSFPGTFFIRNFKNRAREAVNNIKNDIIRDFEERAIAAFRRAAQGGRTQIRESNNVVWQRIVRKNGSAIWQRVVSGKFASGVRYE